jgi:Na+-translocating ferredoxin:NAD+ oxidoreductase RnfC subunit
MLVDIVAKVREAGVVGAGGAGFPAHVKAGSRVDCVIANGAECEPLIHKDLEVMVRHPREIVRGVRLMMQSTGAPRGIIGIKAKNKPAVDAITSAIAGNDITVFQLGDFYPSGDEYVLVYEATGRLIPPQGIPLHVGVVVNNVETLYNVAAAESDQAVVSKFLTVAGAVRKPATFRVPIGTSFKDVITAAGGAKTSDFAVFVGGLMMGQLEFDLTRTVSKTTAGFIVLPRDHALVRRKSLPEKTMHRIGKSACDQCTYCTEFCPRYLLGYDVQPHKVMRSLGFTKTGEGYWNQFAALCCACGLCTLYACPEALFPKEACDKGKQEMKAQGITWSGKMDVKPHAMYEGRRTPLKLLMKRLAVEEFDVPAHFADVALKPPVVKLALTQHVGAAAEPLVRVGEMVHAGQCIGEIPQGKLGSRIHASIDGRVTAVDAFIEITRG